MNNNALKSIGELKDYHFYVEDYQRGYKWTNVEVNQLLDDINEFKLDDINDSNKEGGFYCLQPLVIKHNKNDSENKFEIIDGQQRVTTIFLLLTFLQEEIKFEITYRTRTDSAEFLRNIHTIEKDPKENVYKQVDNLEKYLKDNIDNYHFFEAYKVIKKWFSNNPNVSEKEFLIKLNKKVKVIWYEVPKIINITLEESKQESIKIFSRINSGKIPLTNGELIKALFLINIEKGEDDKMLQLKQYEIAYQWDIIEATLQNDAFWYFISNNKPPATRIDLLFELIISDDYHTKFNKQEKLFSFFNYNENFKETKLSKVEWVQLEWGKVQKLFSILQGWYNDKQLYHFIGFQLSLSSPKTSINDCLKLNKDKTKSQFLIAIKESIKIGIPIIALKDIEYGNNNNNIKNILLFYNILTLLKNDSSTNFPFNKFKNENWDIEHIHAQESININNKEDWKIWRKETVQEIKSSVSETPKKEALLNEINEVTDENLTQKGFDKLFQLASIFFKEMNNEIFEPNNISNLALLNAGINRSYKNAIFPVKRRKIAEQDEVGKFIPICTKNVFLKYYSTDLSQMFLWTNKDRVDYLKNMNKTLNKFFN